MRAVIVPRWMLVTLVAALAASLLALAFLLGRTSAAPGEPVGPPPRARNRTRATPASHLAPTVAPEPTPEVASLAPMLPIEPFLPIGVESSPTPGAAQEAGGPLDASGATPVAAYFTRIDQIQGAGGLAGGQEGAQRILMATLQGDSSELDRLITETDRTWRELGTVQPPAECAAYHATLLRLMGESRAMLGDLRAALVSASSDGLADLASKASALQTGTEELKAMEQELRRQHGLPTP